MKTKILILVGLLLSMLAMSISAAAQDDAPACDIPSVLSLEYKGLVEGEWLQSVIITLNANIEDNDAPNFLGTARELRAVLTRLEANCRGMSFDIEQDGQAPVLGPLTFADGIWKAIFTVEKAGSVEVEGLSGDCEPDSGFLFTAAEGTEETIFKAKDGCEALIIVSYISSGWSLQFVPIKLDE